MKSAVVFFALVLAIPNLVAQADKTPLKHDWQTRFLSAADEGRVLHALETGDYSDAVKSGIRGLLARIDAGYIPSGMTFAEIEDDTLCSKVAGTAISESLGIPVEDLVESGFFGNSWELYNDIPSHGGSFVWTQLWTVPLQAAALRPGDILGVHYSRSRFNHVFKDDPLLSKVATPYTHVLAIILPLPAEGEVPADALVVHEFKPPVDLLSGKRSAWPVRVELLSSFLSRFSTTMRVAVALRPSYP